MSSVCTTLNLMLDCVSAPLLQLAQAAGSSTLCATLGSQQHSRVPALIPASLACALAWQRGPLSHRLHLQLQVAPYYSSAGCKQLCLSDFVSGSHSCLVSRSSYHLPGIDSYAREIVLHTKPLKRRWFSKPEQ